VQSLTAGMAVAASGPPVHLVHLHNFRGLAIAFIVATHCISAFDWSDSPQLEGIVKRAMANGTVFFAFIAGYLFEHLAPRYRPGAYLANKLKNVLLPYLLVSALPIAAILWAGNRPGVAASVFELPLWAQALYFVTTGAHVAPFWFIPTIAVFYLVSPLLHRVFRHERSYAVLPLLVVLSILVPRGNLQPLQSFVHFLSIWVLGMACCHFRLHVDVWLDRYLGSLLVVVAVLMVLDLYLADGSHSAYSLLGKMMLSLLLLGVLGRLGSVANRWLALMGSLSFGIFFLHSYLITAAKFAVHQLLGDLPDGSLAGLVLAAMLASVASIGLVLAIQRLLGARSRLFIGV
jgi:peptidoglycan/LPS O-acetylase OafA/YrhL